MIIPMTFDQRISRADVDQRVEQRLSERQVRYTAGRRWVVRSMLDLGGPVTIAQLLEAVGDAVPLSSLYRTMALLDDAGITHKTHDAGGVARYELAEWLLGHHHHLVCVECGEVSDIELAPGQEQGVDQIVDDAATAEGFAVLGHRIDIEGRCRKCQP